MEKETVENTVENVDKPLNTLYQIMVYLKECIKKEHDQETKKDIEALRQMYVRAYAFKYNEIKKQVLSLLTAQAHLDSIQKIKEIITQNEKWAKEKIEDSKNIINTYFDTQDVQWVKNKIVIKENQKAILYSIAHITESVLDEIAKETQKTTEEIKNIKKELEKEIHEKAFTGLHVITPVRKTTYTLKIIKKESLEEELFDINTKKTPNESRIKKWAIENPEKAQGIVEIIKKEKFIKIKKI
ncbi:MAG: hypothetical protein RML94_00235 [Bacteroidia bacterium]|nr:hypothetical protein [Bacteroidia bacterium]